MGSRIVDLSKYRLSQASEDYNDAKLLLSSGSYKSSVNRSYYAIFHTLRALTALSEFDSSKHSGIIAYVNQHFVKEGFFDKSLSKMIDSAYRLREAADYKDFEVVSRNEAEEQLKKAAAVMDMVESFLQGRWRALEERNGKD